MGAEAFGELALNASLLLACALVVDLVGRGPSGGEDRRSRVVAGLLIGLTGVMILSYPWRTTGGIVVDTRSVLLSVTGLFFGGLPTVIAGVMMGLYRVQMGGAGVVVGIASIVISAGIGLAVRTRWQRRLPTLRIRDLWVFGLTVTLAVIGTFLLLPDGRGGEVVAAVGPTMLLVYPVATALLGRILVERAQSQALARRATAEEQRLRLAIEAGRLGVFEQGLVSGSTTINPRYARMLGGLDGRLEIGPEELLERAHPDDRMLLIAILEGYRTGARTEHEVAFRVLGPGQGDRWIRSVGRLVGVGTLDDPLRISGIAVDVTEEHARTDRQGEVDGERSRLLADSDAARRALLSLVEDLRLAQLTQQETLERYRALIAQAPVPIFVNRNGRIAITNQAMVRLIGVTDESELLGRSPLDIFDPIDHDRVNERIRLLRTERAALPPAEFWIRRRDGATVAIEASASPFDDHGEVSIHVVFRDMSDQKAAEAALVALNTELETRVRERTVELENAYRELESFSYSVSHDLRAPLRAITGFSQILERRYAEQLDETGRHYLDNISTAGQRMGALIEDLLGYSRVGRRQVRREPLDVGVIADAVVATLAPRLIDTGASIGTEGPLAVPMGDPTLFQQVLQNLIANGIVYAQPGVPPDVTIRSVRVDGHVEVSVQDNGIGIAPEHHERVFEVFARLHTEDEIPGTGIGLAIVRKAARLMEGDVSLESAPGAGSRFVLRLPAASPDALVGGRDPDSLDDRMPSEARP